jgi:hypothetical protein
MSRDRCSVRVPAVLMVVLVIAAASALSGSAEECGWLAIEKVDEAFPEQSPWTTMSGGIGSCMFIGNDFSSTFSVSAIVKRTKEVADEYVRSLREGLLESFEVESAPELGTLAFAYRPTAAMDESVRAVSFVAHQDRVVVMSSINLDDGITAEQIEAARPLIAAALTLSEDEDALEAATNCPWFDAEVLAKLFGAPDYEQNVLGETMCMANAGSRVVLVTITETDDAESSVAGMTALAEEWCTTEELSELGTATLQYECTSGNPRATVRVATGPGMVEYTLVPGDGEPTANDRKHLVELARRGVTRAQP